MDFIKDLFDKRPAFDKLTTLLKSNVCVYNGLNLNKIDYIDHLKHRHLNITIGVYETSYTDGEGKFQHMELPLVELWIDKDKNIVEISEDFDRTGVVYPSTLKANDGISRKGRKLVDAIKKLGKLETENSMLNDIIGWFYKGPIIYFCLSASDVLNQDHDALLHHLESIRSEATKDKWKQKDIIHKLNCSK